MSAACVKNRYLGRSVPLLLALLAPVLVVEAADPPRQPPATVLLIRHAEKPPVGSHLSWLGVERAERLPQLFNGPEAAPPHNLPRPAFLFAAHAGKRSNRPVETLIPLSKALHVPINTDFGDFDSKRLARLLLRGEYAGAVVLVSWRHDRLPELATALGATPPYKKWPDPQFDRLWRIDYRDGVPVVTDLPQALLASDSE